MTAAWRLRLLTLPLALACGFAAAELLHRSPDAAMREELHGLSGRIDALARQLSARGSGNGSACAAVVDLEPVREEVRRALATVPEPRVELAVPLAAPDPPRSQPAPSAEARAAAEQGRALVSEAIADGVWREAQAVALRDRLGRMDATAREELLGELLPAINDQRLRLETDGPPF